MSAEPLLRITVLAHRNRNLTEEQFHAHWTTRHAPLVASWLQRHGVVKYTQYHTPTAHKQLTSQPTLSYDGTADFYVRKYEDFQKAYEDPYYQDVVKPDEEFLFEVASMRVLVGTETCVIEGGEIVGGRGEEG
ncbi:EthD domain-containing protein [Boeremia exigua]|uniref:EthD domain-containing protein n=1 Tax=Boeremia exigua TaxID=749465 RepID=UPI001E8E93FD|nr:EthD domain-containing protein [Boeremia exigua]KAH6644247.1 EthD domain-containing protein [Boeremia exigua]